ncbi:MAG: dihydrolipoyllysine-residue acetyltransferase [Gammaproteobacteria bacterium]|nr:dihydrolipoyllysine-residue acetyltransferase [Gammaproteobacteria bacterium]MBU1556579.1 dihydrolipoyllysine-residue acetyltransferase [Gammaproteobacteria bacterium]MBU2072619.1 dihydrolipoyllysine-residue acetyltransferase [Gammaproteobacteria bacterium]MBU2182247.1 dihydrolipoyllysine-residue acetyltransferase [Gammaproteobacteria bacterium]
MKKDFILPDIGEGIVECEIVDWLVAEGDTITEDQPVCDVMTDKALVQIPAVHNGVVSKLYYAKGDIAKVHAPLFEMQLAGSDNSEAAVTPVADTQAVAASSVSEDFILPDIGEGIVECEIVDWLVSEGDDIVEDQPVCDVMTDKALVQIPAKYSGKVTRLYYAKGDIAKVHAPLFAMQHGGLTAAAPAAAANTTPTAAPAKASCALQQNSASTIVSNNGKALASPAVRRLARELSIDISKVPGSGEKGRVYKDDVRAFAEGKVATSAGAATTANAATTASVTAAAVTSVGGSRTEPIKGIKAAMARQMVESVSTIPHFTYCEEIDLTELIALRASLKDQYAKQGVKLTMMPFFIKALSLAINQYPIMNAKVNADCTELTYFDDHNIGIAVDSKIGLLVPNIKGCQHKSIIDIANDLTRLTEQAREGRVSPADLKGGTISISNIGALGGTVATPIINKPELAIVALGKVQTLPRFNSKGEVEARQLMQISWSGDHRVIDGGTIARFTNLWKQYLEQPSAMLVAMR